jgi:hypothetical protein
MPVNGRKVGIPTSACRLDLSVGRASAETFADNEWMPSTADIEAQWKERGIRIRGNRDMARRFADLLADDEQVIDMVRAFSLKKDRKVTVGFIVFALTDGSLILGVREQQFFGGAVEPILMAMPCDELSDLSILDDGQFEWTCAGHWWTFVPPQDLVRVGANGAKANRFSASLKTRLPTESPAHVRRLSISRLASPSAGRS